MRIHAVSCYAIALCIATSVMAQEARFPSFRTIEINPEADVNPAIVACDINADGKPDIVTLSNTECAWYENPTWERHVISGQLKNLMVCLAPYDLDGDKIPELAIGADWQFDNTAAGGALYLLVHNEDVKQPWRAIELVAEEPTLHRIRWADTDGDKKPELIVAPLKGRNTTAPAHQETGVDFYLLRPSAAPFDAPWKKEAIDTRLHVLHNFLPVPDAHGDALFTASFEGITLHRRATDGTWSSQLRLPGSGEPIPRAGAGEVKVGSLGEHATIATVEPWHGDHFVVYVSLNPGLLVEQEFWHRLVIDKEVAGGHALGWADFDGDGADELVAGFRDKAGAKQLPGLNLYDFDFDPGHPTRLKSYKMVIDDGGMATEDLAVADFNGDGKPDFAAVGRATHNIRLYENLGMTSSAKAK